MLNRKEKVAFHRNTAPDGHTLSAQEREGYLKRFLPPTPTSTSPSPSRFSSRPPQSRPKRTKPPRKKPIRTLIKKQIYTFVFALIQAFFGVYIRLRRAYHAVLDRILAVLYYHHRTPEMIQRDVRNLSRMPRHLSVILSLNREDERGAGLEVLLNDVGEISAWCASAGIPELSIYERTGILKHYIPQTHHVILRTLQAYFGNTMSARCPTVSIRAPNQQSFSPPTTPLDPTSSAAARPHLTILLLSEDDGRNTLVDLTKTLADMAQKQKISPDDVQYELVDTEITESVMAEPDLLLTFGPRVVLEGYPPWQLRLTEIFHVKDNAEGVGYQVFLRAVHRYAKAQMRFGR